MFAPCVDLDGVPRWDALLEMLLIEQALTFNQQIEAARIISICGGGDILVWQWIPQTWTPSMCMVRQDNLIIVWVLGTENLQQMWGDLIGAYAAPYTPFTNYVHTFFQQTWQNVRNRVVPNLPADWRSCKFRFVGHSLGAAVAFLGSLEWKRDNPAMTVDMLTCAMPKSLTDGYTGLMPDSCNFVASPNDLVPLVPSNGLVSAVAIAGGAWAWSIPTSWRHYATGWYIDNLGIMRRITGADEGLVPNPLLIVSTATDHYLDHYLDQVATGVQMRPISETTASLLPIVAESKLWPVVQTLANNVNADQYISIPGANALLFESGPDSPLTPENVSQVNNLSGRVTGIVADSPISTQPFGGSEMAGSKITFFWVQNQQGFTESYYHPTLSPDGVTEVMLQTYLAKRVRITGRQTSLKYIRVSDADNPRRVVVWVEADFKNAGVTQGTAGTTAANGQSDYGSTALLVRKMAGNAFSRFWLRGVPDSVVTLGGQYDPVNGFGLAFDDYVNTVKALTFAWRGTDGGVNPPQLITNIVQAPGTQATFTLGGNLFNVGDVGKSKVIRISRQRNPNTVNGTHTVQVVSQTSCITLAPLPVGGFIAGTGKMYYPNQVFKAITNMKVEVVTSKKVGVPFGVSRGRSKRPARV